MPAMGATGGSVCRAVILRLPSRGIAFVCGLICGIAVAGAGELAVAGGASAASLAVPPGDAEVARVVFVHDGDTIDVMLAGRRVRVRYIGIDAPELSDQRPAVAALAQSAWMENRRMVQGREVALEWDVERTDVYGRLLAYVYVEPGIFVNGWLVEQGLARTLTIPPNVKHRDALRALELAARAGGRGMWAASLDEQDETMGLE